jgi:hypothetical protein
MGYAIDVRLEEEDSSNPISDVSATLTAVLTEKPEDGRILQGPMITEENVPLYP